MANVTTRIGDTLLRHKQVVYRAGSYRATASGYVAPRMEGLAVSPRTMYQTAANGICHPIFIKPKKKCWRPGLLTGYPGGWRVVAEVSHNLFIWQENVTFVHVSSCA